jgi:arylsulfatase A-like enzyme
MKKIVLTLGSLYKNNALLLVFYSILMLVLMLGYRIEIFHLVKDHYPDFQSLTLCDFLRLSAHYDAAAALCAISAFAVLITLAGRHKKTFITASSLALIIISAFLLISIDFFKTYETTFQTSFLGKEHTTALPRVLASIYSEMSARLIARMAFISLALVALTMVAARDWFHRGLPEMLGPGRGRLVLHALPLTILLPLAIITIAGASEPNYLETAQLMAKKPSKAMVSNLKEFSHNPLYNLLFPAPRKLHAVIADSSLAHESGFLDTTSRHFPVIHNRIEAVPRGKKYNIILFFFESTPAQYLDITIGGKTVAPTWQRMMRNSFLSLNHYANYPLSANALLSTLTSSYSMFTKEPVIEKYPDIPLKTASELLKSSGYRTCLLHTGMLRYAGQDRFLKHRKFDVILEYRHLKKPPYEDWVGWGLHERSMIEPSIEFIKKDRSAPFFVVYMPVNPHHPYAIPDDSYQITGPIDASLNYREKNWLKYLNSLHYCDAILGELIDRLEAEGLMDDTLFFLFSDHGEAFYQHSQNYNHPLFIYEENTRLPLLIYNKKFFPATMRYQGVSSHVDILPTILDILGIGNEGPMEGLSLFSRHRQQMALLKTTWKDDLVGVRDGRWKYIRRVRDCWEELYDLTADPEEKNNLAPIEGSVLQYYRSFTVQALNHTMTFYDRVLNIGAGSEDRGKADLEGKTQKGH